MPAKRLKCLQLQIRENVSEQNDALQGIVEIQVAMKLNMSAHCLLYDTSQHMLHVFKEY